MRGRHRDVKKRLLEINLRVFYISCGCHRLNFALCDMANCCPKIHVEGLTVKPLSQICWKSHVQSIKLIKEQTAQIRDILVVITNTNEDPKTKSEVESLGLSNI